MLVILHVFYAKTNRYVLLQLSQVSPIPGVGKLQPAGCMRSANTCRNFHIYIYIVVPRDTIVSGNGYLSLPTESQRNICSEIRQKVQHTNKQFFKVHAYYRRLHDVKVR